MFSKNVKLLNFVHVTENKSLKIQKLLPDLNPVPADLQSDDLHVPTELQSNTLKLIDISARTILLICQVVVYLQKDNVVTGCG